MISVQKPITGMESTETDTPVGALSQCYSAFNNRNLELMRRNRHQDECVLNNPQRGIRRGWNEIEPLYSRLFNGPVRVYVEYFDYTLHVGDNLCCSAGRERETFEKGETRIDLTIRTSRIYRRADEQWKQMHHHGSIDDPALLHSSQIAVLGGKS